MNRGRIFQVNLQRGMVIVEIESRDFAVFEILDGIELEVGDEVGGNLEALGGEQLRHLESGRGFSAYGQTGPSSLGACRALL